MEVSTALRRGTVDQLMPQRPFPLETRRTLSTTNFGCSARYARRVNTVVVRLVSSIVRNGVQHKELVRYGLWYGLSERCMCKLGVQSGTDCGTIGTEQYGRFRGQCGTVRSAARRVSTVRIAVQWSVRCGQFRGQSRHGTECCTAG